MIMIPVVMMISALVMGPVSGIVIELVCPLHVTQSLFVIVYVSCMVIFLCISVVLHFPHLVPQPPDFGLFARHGMRLNWNPVGVIDIVSVDLL